MKKITEKKKKYYAIVGLVELGRSYQKKCEEVSAELRELTGEKDEYGHCSDVLWETYSVDEFLKRVDMRKNAGKKP